jgi:hypothetical protein
MKDPINRIFEVRAARRLAGVNVDKSAPTNLFSERGVQQPYPLEVASIFLTSSIAKCAYPHSCDRLSFNFVEQLVGFQGSYRY